jgi:hypothetical protein
VHIRRGLRPLSATSPQDFRGWVVRVGFYDEQSYELAELSEMPADAQVARWQSKYGRDSVGPHGPTAIVASEQDKNGHSHDWD